jgi:hypothetical protein
MKKYFLNGEHIGYRLAGPWNNGVDVVMARDGFRFSNIGIIHNEVCYKPDTYQLSFTVRGEKYTYGYGMSVYRSNDDTYIVDGTVECPKVYTGEMELVTEGIGLIERDEYIALKNIEKDRNAALMCVKSRVPAVQHLAKIMLGIL